MQNLLRGLAMAGILAVAWAGALPATPFPKLMACADPPGGHCSVSDDINCATRSQCPSGETCVCN